MANLLVDLRHSWRAFRRRIGTMTLAVVTLGLGIGASTAMFSILDAVMLRPLPYPDPEAVVSIYTANPQYAGHPTMNSAAERGVFSYPEFRAIRENAEGVLEGIAFVSHGPELLETAEGAESLTLGWTSSDLFSRVLRTQALAGRVFNEDDERQLANVLVLTESYWQLRFGRDLDVIGTSVRIDGEPFELIGILPSEAGLAGMSVDAWVLREPNETWGAHTASAVARLAPQVSIEQAASRLTSSLRVVLPPDHDPHGINVFSRQADETRGASGAIWLLMIASLVLLVTACGNVALLLIGVALDREQEFAIRSAIGAGRSRIIQQMLVEVLLLGALAIMVGVAVAHLATRGLVLLAPSDVPRIGEVVVSERALAFAAASAVVCSLLLGLVSALRAASGGALQRSSSTRGATGSARSQAVVVVGELTLATTLLVGAGLLTRTLLALNAVDPGIAIESTVGLRVAAAATTMAPEADDESARTAALANLYAQVKEELATLPGVVGVASTSNLPLSPDRASNDVRTEFLDEPILAERRFVSHDYFDVAGVEILEGRAFESEENREDGARVAVISEGLARDAFPGVSPLGRSFHYLGDREAVIVGVAANVMDEQLGEESAYAYYVPERQILGPGGSFLVRATGEPENLIGPIRRHMQAMGDGVAITFLEPMTMLVAEQVASERYRARLVAVFALTAAFLSLLGIYGVTARSVAARTREFGIRKALGAGSASVMRLILMHAGRLAVLGMLGGFVLSTATSRLTESYVWGVSTLDPITLGVAAVVIGTLSVLAAAVPAVRAAGVDPQVSLRAD